MLLLLDFETYSSADLKKTGPYVYTESPDFLPLMCAWLTVESVDELRWVTEDRVHLVTDPREMMGIPGLFDPGVPKVAHQALFERLVLSRMAGYRPGEYLPPEQFIDTMALGAVRGLPQSLDGMARGLGVDPKDSAGGPLIRYFSRPNRSGQRNLPESAPEKWADFCRYGRQDVATMGQVLHALGPDFPTQTERRVWDTDQRINDAGIRTDLGLAERAIEADARNRGDFLARLGTLLGVENPNSVQQFTAGLADLGLEVPNLRAATVERLLASEDLTEDQRAALELRSELAGSAVKKFQAVMMRTSSDGRYRGCFRYFGAHTGRWSGSGVQLQNLPRETIHGDKAEAIDHALETGCPIAEAEARVDAEAVRAAIDRLDETGRLSPRGLKALIRPSLLGPFVVVDFAAIEARVLAWLAGERWALEAFAAGRDIYVETAERMGGLSRQQGKVAVLALGFQGGIGSLRVMGAQGSDDELDRMKVQWRRANQAIVRFWSELAEAFAQGGRAGRLRVDLKGRDRWIKLPSGRSVVYRNAAYERWHFTDEDGRRRSKEAWRFDSPQDGGKRTDTYGGRLAENVTQAVARDLLAETLVRLDAAGYRVVGHVHDEVMVEAGPDEVEAITEIMCQSPDWADGLPLAAEGFATVRYRKG